MDETKAQFDRLRGADNYPTWHPSMMAVLITKKLSKIVRGQALRPAAPVVGETDEVMAAKTAAIEAWEENDEMARAQILLRIDSSIKNRYNSYMYQGTAAGFWLSLRAEFNDSSLNNAANLGAQLDSARYKLGDNVVEFLDRLETLRSRLALVGQTMMDHEFIARIAKCFVTEDGDFETLIDAIETMVDNRLSWGVVRTRIIGKIERKTNRTNESEAFKTRVKGDTTLSDADLAKLSISDAQALVGKISRIHGDA